MYYGQEKKKILYIILSVVRNKLRDGFQLKHSATETRVCRALGFLLAETTWTPTHDYYYMVYIRVINEQKIIILYVKSAKRGEEKNIYYIR